MIDKSQIGVNPKMWVDHRGNYYSTCKLSNEQLIDFAVMCWHMRQSYYRDGYVRVPIPATNNGMWTFTTNIVNTDGIEISVGSEKMSDGLEYPQINGYTEFPTSIAKFAEVILGRRDVLETAGLAPKKDWEIVNFLGLPEKDVPPQPLEMAISNDACQYLPGDYARSILFWARHIIVRR